MTNSIALVLAALIVVLLSVDAAMYDSQNLIFLSRKFVVLLSWLAFWR